MLLLVTMISSDLLRVVMYLLLCGVVKLGSTLYQRIEHNWTADARGTRVAAVASANCTNSAVY
jgi:hypothetical protein